MDNIFISELKIETRIGVYEWEKKVPQTLQLDLEVGLPGRHAANSGKLDDTIGPKRVIAISMGVLLFAVIAILLVDKDHVLLLRVDPPVPGGPLFAAAAEKAYLLLGCLIGAAGGPLQAASRTLLIRIAPQDRIAQYFGLFALTGKVTSFTGPLLIGIVTAATASQKSGMAVLVLFFVTGLALLARVRER